MVERLIGTNRRERLDHIIVINEKHLKRTLGSYFRYYHGWQTHRSLGMNCPEPREYDEALNTISWPTETDLAPEFLHDRVMIDRAGTRRGSAII